MSELKRIIKEQKKIFVSFFLIIVVIPFVFVSMWQAGMHETSFGIYDGDGSALSKNIVQMLDSTDNLEVTYFAESPEELQDAVKYKKVAAGIIIPENFNMDIKNKLCPTVILMANGTDLILGGNALGSAAKVIGTLNAGTQIMTLQGGGLMPQTAMTAMGTFSYVERLMYEPTAGIIPKLMYSIPLLIILSIFMQKFFMPYMLQKRKTMINCKKGELKGVIKECIVTVALVAIWIVFSSYVGMQVLGWRCDLPLRGSTPLYLVSMGMFMLNLIAFGMICFACTRKEMYYPIYVQVFCTITATHMIMSSVTYPFYMMPDWVRLISRIFYPVTPMAYELKALNLKGIGWEQAMPYLLDSLRYTVMWMAISGFILKKDLQRNRRRYNQIDKPEQL